MKILVSGATKTVKRIGGEYLGHLQTPQTGNDLDTLLRSGLPWAADNAAFSNPDDIKFWNMVIDAWSLMQFNPPMWVAVPDVVGNHEQTLEMFHGWVNQWEEEIGHVPVPLAFVLQNGATIDSIPWEQIVAVFVGGDDNFKLNDCIPLVEEARARGKMVHVGRVNSLKRLRFAMGLGADTVDGSGYSKFAEATLPRAIAEIASYEAQPMLF